MAGGIGSARVLQADLRDSVGSLFGVCLGATVGPQGWPRNTGDTINATERGSSIGAFPNIVPISDLRQDASGIVNRASASGEPVFITQRGRASAVLVSAGSCERTQHELAILRLLVRGEADIAAGRGYDLNVVMTEADALLGES